MRTISLKHFPVSFLLLAIILFLSFFNPPSTDLNKIQHFDKFVHFGMYGVLSGTIWLEYLYHYRTRFCVKTALVVAWALPVITSAFIELGQEYLTTNRSGDYLDFLCNLAGATAAIPVALYVVRPRMK